MTATGAYDSDPLTSASTTINGVQLIAPHKFRARAQRRRRTPGSAPLRVAGKSNVCSLAS